MDSSLGIFAITQRSDPSPTVPGAITGRVLLMRKSNQMAKSYEASHDSSWLILFDEDLKCGIFGARVLK